MKPSDHRLLLIVNPISGTRSKRGLAEAIEKHARSADFDITTAVTSGPGDATRIAADAARQGYYGVLACGGDGTVNETAAGLIGTKTALGILPNGSGNGLARHIGIPSDPLMAFKVVKKRRIVDCDYCTVNERPFFCTFGVGFDAAVSHRFANGNSRGLINYLKSALGEFIKYAPETYTLLHNGEELTEEAFLIACCNASQYGNNAFIAPTASITDGMLDITIVHSSNPLSQALVGVDLMTGFIGNNALIDTIRAKSLTIIRKNDGMAHLDGEPVIMPARLDVVCHHGGLNIFAPKKRFRFMPLLTPARLTIRDWAITIGGFFGRR